MCYHINPGNVCRSSAELTDRSKAPACSMRATLTGFVILRTGRSQSNKFCLRQRAEGLGERRIDKDAPTVTRRFRRIGVLDLARFVDATATQQSRLRVAPRFLGTPPTTHR